MSYGAYMSASRGYDLSLFETSGTAAKKPAPKKVKKRPDAANRIVELYDVQEEQGQRRQHNFAALAFGFIIASIIVVVVGIVIHGQVQLAELNQKITAANVKLETSRSEYIQLQAKVDASLSTATVEEYARENLGMSRATNQQKRYISLADSDKAEIFAENEGTVFDEVGEYFDSMLS